ncbi:hypothetical protein MAR_005436 [Mya arenaria]|uniref:Uncharacterized protein n=1 Tax=Mya arenaria TaxID=6604 RepID=A0ABY7F2Q5_MYAAR|nr:hypothetical protein MAR_005436 [Mya arenaria]
MVYFDSTANMIYFILSFTVLYGLCRSETTTPTIRTDPTTAPPKVGKENPCLNYTHYEQAYINHRKNKPDYGPIQFKTCVAPYNVTCIIMTYSTVNGQSAHQRDCSDDKTFGLDPTKWQRYLPITKDVPRDNITKCAWDDTDQVCLSRCDTEFCNGPDFGRGSITTVSGFVLIGFYIFKVIF